MAGLVPRALEKGETIAFVSPSYRRNLTHPIPHGRAKSHLEHLGYNVKIVFNNETPQPDTHHAMVLHRCEELHSAFRDPDVKAIICTTGGETANELLPYLDYALIKANPKIFCGMSDITHLHYGIYSQTGLHTYYGPTALSEFAEYPEPHEFTIKHFLRVLSKDSAAAAVGPLPRSLEFTDESHPYRMDQASEQIRGMHPAPRWTWVRPGKASGRVFGGCLPSVLSLSGTQYRPNYEGRILLLETPGGSASPFPLGDVQTILASLVNCGIIAVISGLVMGRAGKQDDSMRKRFAQIILDQCYRTEFPILMDVDVGHTSPLLTIPLNALMSLDSENDEWKLLEPAVLSD